ncbi:4'-phosphopantetheinyl transferase family protein [Rhodopirellula sp. JC639]|uniref:4'-phosphopantetheinyl transferase family protein n=1 Tax=Stieleria mannarensis TaxID=2755585 RepID=UPI001602C5C2|nr:4'-phosphopantetheinyl transferase superfamily protein [Rhodopirellula sp. JC639]
MMIRGNESWTTATLRLDGRESTPPWPMALRSWLTPPEINELDCFRAPNRRRDWISGRWCAKQMLGELLSAADDSPLEWQILSRASVRRGCRPAVFRHQIQQPIDLSLAHTALITVAAVCLEPHDRGHPISSRIGVDVVDRTDLPNSFAQAWFSAAERRRLEDHGWPIAAGWAAKEAAFKACNDGEPFRPGHAQIARVTAQGCTIEYETRRTADVRFDVRNDAIIAVARTSSPGEDERFFGNHPPGRRVERSEGKSNGELPIKRSSLGHIESRINPPRVVAHSSATLPAREGQSNGVQFTRKV